MLIFFISTKTEYPDLHIVRAHNPEEALELCHLKREEVRVHFVGDYELQQALKKDVVNFKALGGT